MSYKEQSSRFHALDQWFINPLGKRIAQVFDEELSHLKHLLHGDIVLQLGSCGDNPWLQSLRFQHKWVAAPSLENSRVTFTTLLNQLALDRFSVDCLILPFTLDAFKKKTNLIDEIDRVLNPMGYVVILSVNPISLWGAWMRYSQKNCFAEQKGHPKSVISIKRALSHRGYIQCYLHGFYYCPPMSNPQTLNKFGILNQIGKMISPVPAGFYCLVMQKYVEAAPTPMLTELEDYLGETRPMSMKPLC